MRILLTTFLLLFAPALAAQDPAADLARAIVIEEQERDLMAAEKIYRAVAADPGADAAVTTRALLRLGMVLQKLGKQAEALATLQRAAELGGEAGQSAKDLLQDPAPGSDREKKLREKAREVLMQMRNAQSMSLLQVMAGRQGGAPVGITGISNADAVRDMLWIGEPAVPEIVAELERRWDPEKQWTDNNYCSEMAGLLWRIGGPKASAFMDRARAHEDVNYRRMVVRTASVAQDPVMVRQAEAFLDDPDPTGHVVLMALTEVRHGGPAGIPPGMIQAPTEHIGHELYRLYPAARLVALVEHPVEVVRIRVLDVMVQDWSQLRHEPDAAATTDRLAPKLRSALDDLDPQVGQAALRFLFSPGIMSSRSGRSLLLARLPAADIDLRDVNRLGTEDTGNWPMNFRSPTEHMDEVLEAARVMGAPEEVASPSAKRHVMARFVVYALGQWTAEAVPGVLELVRLGYSLVHHPIVYEWVRAHATTEHLVAIASQVELFGSPDMLVWLGQQDLPREAWPALLRLAEEAEAPQDEKPRVKRAELWRAMARTGAPEAVEFFREALRRYPTGMYPSVADATLWLSAKNDSEPVRELLRELLVREAAEAEYHRNAVFGRLAQLGDEAAIELYPKAYGFGLGEMFLNYPWTGDLDERARGVGWLAAVKVGRGDRTWHGYSLGQLQHAWRAILALDDREVWRDARLALVASNVRGQFQFGHTGYGGGGSPLGLRDVSPELPLAVGDLALTSLANHPTVLETPPPRPMIVAALCGAVRPGEDGMLPPAQHAFADRCLTHPAAEVRDLALRSLRSPATRELADLVVAMLDDEDSQVAAEASREIARAGIEVQGQLLDRMLASRQSQIRDRALAGLKPDEPPEVLAKVASLVISDPSSIVRIRACNYLGSIVDTNGVTALMAALRDPVEGVRTAAATALDQIRYYHEQKTHWARVFAGVDTSSNAAAEKLLSQAKPDQDKAIRLLAIRSLGALAVPETLPFLIDYSKDADPDIAAAAKSAVELALAKAAEIR